MKVIKEAIRNLNNNKKHFVLFILLSIIIGIFFDCLDLSYSQIQNHEKYKYQEFTNQNLILDDGSFSSDILNYFTTNDIDAIGWGRLKRINISNYNKKIGSFDVLMCSGPIDGSYAPGYYKNQIEKLDLVYGRDFNDFDRYIGEREIIVNESLCNLLFGSVKDSLEKKVYIGDDKAYIVGVVKDTPGFVKYNSENELYEFNVYISSKPTSKYDTIILNSKDYICQNQILEIRSDLDNAGQHYSLTSREDIDDMIKTNSNNSNKSIENGTKIGCVVVYAVFLIIMMLSRKQEVVIKKNLGAYYVDILFEFISEYAGCLIFAFAIFLVPNALLLWNFEKSFLALNAYPIVMSNQMGNILFRMLVETGIMMIIVLFSTIIIYFKDTAKSLRE